MMRTKIRPALAALGAVLWLAGCSPGPLVDRLPEGMGLPAGAPARPATPYQYPAVHDMPPPRATRPMTEEELLKAEKDLRLARDRQEIREGQGPGAAPAAKKRPADAKSGQAAGAKDSKNTGVKSNP